MGVSALGANGWEEIMRLWWWVVQSGAVLPVFCVLEISGTTMFMHAFKNSVQESQYYKEI